MMNLPAFFIALFALILCVFGLCGNAELYRATKRQKYMAWIIIMIVCICTNCYVLISELLKLCY